MTSAVGGAPRRQNLPFKRARAHAHAPFKDVTRQSGRLARGWLVCGGVVGPCGRTAVAFRLRSF